MSINLPQILKKKKKPKKRKAKTSVFLPPVNLLLIGWHPGERTNSISGNFPVPGHIGLVKGVAKREKFCFLGGKKKKEWPNYSSIP